MDDLTKRCPNCREIKHTDDFAYAASRKDNLQGYCRDCQSAIKRLWKGKPRNGPKRKVRVKRQRHVWYPWWPLLLREKRKGKRWSLELQEIVLAYLDLTDFTYTEIAWRCNVSRQEVSRFMKRLQRFAPGWKRRARRNYVHKDQCKGPAHRRGVLQGLTKIRKGLPEDSLRLCRMIRRLHELERELETPPNSLSQAN